MYLYPVSVCDCFQACQLSFPVWQADKVFSEAHDDLYQFSLESHRWFPMALRKPKAVKADAPEAASAAAEASSAAAADSAQAADGAATTGGEEKVCWIIPSLCAFRDCWSKPARVCVRIAIKVSIMPLYNAVRPGAMQ